MEPIRNISNRLNVRAELHEEELRLTKPLSEKDKEQGNKKKNKDEESEHPPNHDKGKGDYVDLDG